MELALDRLLLHFSKALNKFFLIKDIAFTTRKPKSLPISITMNLSNICNLSCKICSLRKLRDSNNLIGVCNQISINEIKAFSDLFLKARSISFMGLGGESIINPYFDEIIKILKNKFNLKLGISTNGLGLNNKIIDTMVDIGFDNVTFSVHSASSENYKLLQGGSFNQVINNIERLQNAKSLLNKPIVTIAYALNKININETEKMIDVALKLRINQLMLYHYRDYGFSEISLDRDYKYANERINEIYKYAKDKGAMHLLPDPPYYRNFVLQEEDEKEKKCYLPWLGLQMRGSYSHKDTYYLGCCNVFNIFTFNYKEHISKYGQVNIKQIWHHPIFQYLRESCNTSKNINRNALCKYCKSKKRDFLKNTNNAMNYEYKLQVIDEFFCNMPKKYQVAEEIEGLRILYSEDEELRSMA